MPGGVSGERISGAAILFFSIRVKGKKRKKRKKMFSIVRSALQVSGRGVQRTISRQSHHKAEPDFHDKYGNVILASGTAFCVGIWAYVITSTGICWNVSPVGRVTPKEWREK